MTIDLDDLEAKARAAGGEEWTREKDWVSGIDSHGFVRPHPEAGRHILAANPAVVLDLVQRLRAAEAIVRDLAAIPMGAPSDGRWACGTCQRTPDDDGDIVHAESCPYRRAVEAKR